jgi:L-2-hydroxyglutarate oxidase
MTAFCREHEILHEICGKVVLAANRQQSITLRELAKRGEANGLQGLKFLNKMELRKRESLVQATEALLVPEEGIVDYKAVMEKLVVLIEERGGKVHFNSPIWSVTHSTAGDIVIQTATQIHSFDFLVSCTGLHSDRSYNSFTRNKSPLRIVPFRGEYLMFKPEFKHMVNHLIYPVPDVKFPFLGVHFTRMISGERVVGPNAVLAMKREGYTNLDFNLRDTVESLTYVGFQKFFMKNFSFAIGEFASSLSKNAFLAKAKDMIPDIEDYMLQKGTAGVRAQALDPQGNLLMDFKVERVANQIHLLNAPSPGATAALSIAKYIIDNYLHDLD